MKTLKFIGLICFCITLSAAQAGQNLLQMPIGTKIIFKQDFTIPPAETSVLIGKASDGYITECRLYLKVFDNSLRKIPKGTEYSIRDTRESYGSRVDLLLESKSLNSIACTTEKPWRNDQPIPENYIAYTTLNQAQRALSGKIELKVNQEAKIIKD